MNNVTKTIPKILKDNICTVFNLLNAIIAAALIAVGAAKNALFISVVILNTVIGIAQEIKAKRQIERLTLLSQPKVTVFRDGEERNITSDEIKKDDILLLAAGSVVCADCVVESGSAEANEAILTGESECVEKHAGDMLLSGVSIISGKCRARAVLTGDECYASKIADEVKKTKQSTSELLRSMKKVTNFTSFLIVPMGVAMFLRAYLPGGASLDSAVVSVSAGLLGMLPKGLVLLIGISLASGVVRLSKKNVTVRELDSLESLAHCDIVCFDKTGTLTDGNLTVESHTSFADEKEFLGLMSAYVRNTDDNNATYSAMREHFELCDDFEAVSTVPFSSDRKLSSVTLKDAGTFVVGAPEKLSRPVPQEATRLMASGKRVVFAGICDGEVKPENIRVVGMIVLSDNIRKNASETIEYFYRQGMDVKIISGDNPLAVSAAAKLASVRDADLGVDTSTLTDEEIEESVDKYTVFGRVTPERKKALIAAMQKKGHKVAMIGDGVNDLTAMRQADCSIAMGTAGDAAKQTARIVPLESDFSVLRDVMAEGRRVVNNITKSAGVFFIKTIYSVLLCLLCLVMGADFPFVPIQITLIDLAIEAFPAFFMSFERNDKKIRGSFLGNAFGSALPNGIAVFMCCATIICAAPVIGADPEQCRLVMYLTVGFVSIAGVVEACRPLGLFHIFLCVSSCLGFVFAVILFAPILQLPALTAAGARILPVSVAAGVAISVLLRWIARRTFGFGERGTSEAKFGRGIGRS